MNTDPPSTTRADPNLIDQCHSQTRLEARSRYCVGLGKPNLGLVGYATTNAVACSDTLAGTLVGGRILCPTSKGRHTFLKGDFTGDLAQTMTLGNESKQSIFSLASPACSSVGH